MTRSQIVSEESGVLNYPNESASPVEADHHTNCKFRSRHDPNYMHAMNLLADLAFHLPLHGKCQPRSRCIRNILTFDILAAKDKIQAVQGILGIGDDFQKDLYRNLEYASPGTCEWLYQHESFQAWMDESKSHNRVLWLTGSPGLGKSVLAAKTAAHIQTTTPCQYHFFMGFLLAKSTGTAAFCLRVLALQLAIEYPKLAERLIRLNEETSLGAMLHDFQAMWEAVFENIILRVDFGRTLYWLFDGLDEADTPELFVQHSWNHNQGHRSGSSFLAGQYRSSRIWSVHT